MTSPAMAYLSPFDASAFTRVVMSFCLGKGTICMYSRSYVLQISQRQNRKDYAFYQARRLRQFLPSVKPARYQVLGTSAKDPSRHIGEWRIRVASRYLLTAYNLLYPQQGEEHRKFVITPPALEALGLEALACLWSDRATVEQKVAGPRARLSFGRQSHEEVELLADWCERLTNVRPELAPHRTSVKLGPSLIFKGDGIHTVLEALKTQWHASAPCLHDKFQQSRTPLEDSKSDDVVLVGRRPKDSQMGRPQPVLFPPQMRQA